MQEATPLSDAIARGCRTLVVTCGDVQPGWEVLVVSDTATQPVGEAVASTARELGARVTHSVIAPLNAHGEEPPAEVGAHMLRCKAIFGLTHYSMAHSNARYQASLAGARYLSLPDYSMQVLAGAALQVDFRALTGQADWLAQRFTGATHLRVRTRLGTDIEMRADGRQGNSTPGWCTGPGIIASPPDAEANVPPLEEATQGVIVVDGSIPCPEIGLLDEPMTLTVRDGRVRAIDGPGASVLESLFDRVGDDRARVIAEFGVGLNPAAQLCGNMLEDEGCAGTAHFGIGSNATIGGTNSVPFHLDHVVRDITLDIDGERILEDGRFVTGDQT